MKDTQLKELADRLSQWSGLSRIGAKEVLVWKTGKRYPQVMIALRGDALRMKRNLLDQPVRNPRPYGSRQYIGTLDLELGQVMGLEDLGQIFTVDDIYPYDFMNGIQTAANEFLGGGEMVDVTLMPKEGEPYNLGDDVTPYFSSKKARVQKGTAPPLVELDMDPQTMENKDIDVAVGIDICAIAPRVGRCSRGAVLGLLADRGADIPFMVTHSFDVTMPKYEDQAERIASCGGMAYPSLAVGQIAASTFGQVALIADVGLLLEALKPYRGRGTWPVVLYETDAWTVRTQQIFNEGAYEMMVELTGRPTNWTYKQDFWTLGVPTEEHKADVIMTTKKMRTALKRRYKVWGRDLDAEDVEQRTLAAIEQEGMGHRIAVAKYPYLEAKVNGIVPMECFPLAVVPRALRKEAQRFLGATGWRGDVVEVDFPVFSTHALDFTEGGRDLRYDYGWLVGDVVMQLAAAQGRVMEVTL